MPRIRKKTSNRASTNDRKKIQHKVREGKKKKAKAAKKNPQWKSKHKKDPGIPNNYPYKEQILAEIQAQRVQAAEEKAKRKADKKIGKEDVSTIAAQALDAQISTKPTTTVEHEENEEAPPLLNHELQHLKAVLDQADVVIEVLDCRDPQSFRSSHLEEVANKKIIMLLNKIDLCPQEAVSAWLCHLRRDHPTFLFRSASAYLPNDKGKAKAPLNDGLGVESLVTHLGQLANGGDPLTVAVVGLTNTGKSSFINTIIRRSLFPIYTSTTTSSRGPSTTEFPQEVHFELLEKRVRFIDTPGLLWEPDPLARVRDVLMRNRGRIDRIKDPMPSVEYIVNRSNAEDLMLLYNLPAFPEGNVDAFVAGVARSSQLVKKRGTLDLAGACRIVLRDWNISKLKWYTMPTDSMGSTIDAKDKSILSILSVRKEMRKAGGLVRFTATMETENRKLLLENAYHLPGDSDNDSDDHSSESDDDVEDENNGSGVESGDEEEDPSAKEEDVVLLAAKKRKRPQGESLPTSKRVSFAPTHDKNPKHSGSKPSSIKVRRAANVPSSAKKDTGDDAYDFGKFF